MNPLLFITLNCGRGLYPCHQIYYIWDSSLVKINTGRESYKGFVSAYVNLNMHPCSGQLITRIVSTGYPVIAARISIVVKSRLRRFLIPLS
jgi:hypothetical protein